MARELEGLFGGPQDVEWASAAGAVWVVQTRPMTALPSPAQWAPPGPGLWACNFRLGEWLPDPVTPLFADWLLPVFDTGFRQAMRETAGAAVSFPYGLVYGWYYATPNPRLAEIPFAIVRSRGRLLRFMVSTVVLPGRRPARAAPALDRLYRDWRDRLLPDYRQLAAVDPTGLDLQGLIALTEQIVTTAGHHFWYLAVVGGAAWKIEAALGRFLARHQLGEVDVAALLSPVAPPTAPPPHAVFSLDWYHPTTAEHTTPDHLHNEGPPGTAAASPGDNQPAALERRCAERLASDPTALATWTTLLQLARTFARIREEQAAALTLGWPLLRRCAQDIGQRLTQTGQLEDPEELFFLTREELIHPAAATAASRRETWVTQRRLTPPLTLGQPPPLIGHRLIQTVGTNPAARQATGDLAGQPASPGRATGPARIVRSPDDFDKVTPGDVLIAAATTPAWTPLFRHVVAVVTDRGTAAAHASIIAREYGIPAVVATGDATRRLTDGTLVTVDGSQGTVSIVP